MPCQRRLHARVILVPYISQRNALIAGTMGPRDTVPRHPVLNLHVQMKPRLSWPSPTRLLERGSALVAGTVLTFFLLILAYRLATDWPWLMRQYSGPVAGYDDLWGRIISGGLLLVVVGWGALCATYIVLDVTARVQGRPSWISRREWLVGAASATLALTLALLTISAM